MEPAIQLADGTRIYLRQPEAEFRTTPAGRAAEVKRWKDIDYAAYHLANDESIEGRTFRIAVYFRDGALSSLLLECPVTTSWRNYERAKEKQAVVDNSAWVTRLFGQAPPISHDGWSMASVLDARNATNSVTIALDFPHSPRWAFLRHGLQ